VNLTPGAPLWAGGVILIHDEDSGPARFSFCYVTMPQRVADALHRVQRLRRGNGICFAPVLKWSERSK